MTQLFVEHDRVRIISGSFKGEVGHVTTTLGDGVGVYIPFSGKTRYVMSNEIERC